MFKVLSMKEFKQNSGVRCDFLPKQGLVVPLRSLAEDGRINMIIAMPMDYLCRMLERVRLAGGSLPYAKSEIHLERISPFSYPVIQTFVQRKKILEFVERFDQIFNGHCVSQGFAKKTPLIAIGEGQAGQTMVAHYVPPILEIGPAGAYLPDGIHRCFLAGRVGSTIETVVIRDVAVQPRAELIDWAEVSVVDEKPPEELRVRSNKPALYRLWEEVGIDG